MSSRFPPTSGDSRYQPRSPPMYRGNSIHNQSGPPRDIPREVPRGPKASLDGGRGAPRGRGYGRRDGSGRGDSRDFRDAPFPRREEGAGWPRRESFETRERRPSPIGRNQSRTPPPLRDYRDSHDLPPNHLDLSRVRRGSRDIGPPSANSNVSDAPALANSYGRGGHRGRGRGGDWDIRGRGRGNFQDNRGSHRSRSRDRMRDRDIPDERPREQERETGRWEEEKRYQKDEWDRDSDRYGNRNPLQRPDSRNSGGSYTRPSTPHSTSAGPYNANTIDRLPIKSNVTNFESSRRPSSTLQIEDQTVRDETRFSKREYPGEERSVLTSSESTLKRLQDLNYPARYEENTKMGRSSQNAYRSENPRVQNSNDSPTSPPLSNQVPPFGVYSHRGLPSTQSSYNNQQYTRDEPPSSAPARFDIDPVKVAPKAPKAELGQGQPPTGPKAGPPFVTRHSQIPGGPSPARSFDRGPDGRTSLQSGPSVVPSPATARFGASQRPPGSQYYSQITPTPQLGRAPNSRTILQSGPRMNYLDSAAHGSAGMEQNVRNNQSDLQPRGFSGTSYQGPPAKIPPRGPRQPSIRAPMNNTWVNNTWVNPTYLRPSIMNTVPATAKVPVKRDYTGEERRASSPPHEWQLKKSTDGGVVTRPEEFTNVKSEQKYPKLKIEEAHGPKADKSETSALDADPVTPPVQVPVFEEKPSKELAVGTIGQAASGSDEDESMDLGEEDLEAAERKYLRDLERLEAKRPPSPRHHVELLSLLEELDALASAADDLAKGILPSFIEPQNSAETTLPIGLPSPQSEDLINSQFEVDEIAKPPKYDADDSSTLSEADLPYLVTEPLTPLSEASAFRSVCLKHEAIKDRMFEYLAEDKARINTDFEQWRRKYARIYKDWKLGIEALEQEKIVQEEIVVVDPAPTPTETAILPAAPVLEVRRGGRSANNGSEYDLQRVIELSIKETAEAEKIREEKAQENQALADLQKEAIIPDMLHPSEAKRTIFQDRNNLIPTNLVLETFGFTGPADPITNEADKQLFTKLFLQNPKRWILIAKGMPGYDTQDCIYHYYVTKKQEQYKQQVNAQFTRKNQRATRGKGRKPGAIMGGRATMCDGNEDEAPQPALTEAGRPRRTAAPVFGGKENVSENDPVTPMAAPGRRAAGQNRTDLGSDSTTERPTAKRGRTAQKEKGAKRGKVPLLAAAPGPAPPKNEPSGIRGGSKEPRAEELQGHMELEEKKAPMIIEANETSNMMSWSNGSRPLDQAAVVEVNYIHQLPPLPPPPPPPQSMTMSQEQSARSLATTSYWSVPEQTDFWKLVGHYGTDWVKIAQSLKTKTHTMCKNYYNREIEKGRTDMQKVAQEADQRVKRGEVIGNPPEPSQTQRRRPDSVTHVTAHRPLAPNTEPLEVGRSPEFQTNGIVQVSPPQHPQAPPPRLAPLQQASNVSATGTPQATSQNTSSTGATSQIASQPQRPSQPLQGPRAGFFPTERVVQANIQPGPAAGRPQVGHEHQPNRHSLQHQHQPQRQPQARAMELRDFEEALLAREHELGRKNTRAIQDGDVRPLTGYSQQLAQNKQTSQTGHLIQPRNVAPTVIDLDRSSRVISQRPSSPIHINPSPPPLRTLEPLGQPPFHPPHNLSPSLPRPLAISPPQELARPSSVPAIQSLQRPAPAPAPAKRSNLMSLLNEESTEPTPRKTLAEAHTITRTPPTEPTRMYQPPSQPQPHFPRREAINTPPQPPQQLPQQQSHSHYPPQTHQIQQQQQPFLNQQQQQQQQQAQIKAQHKAQHQAQHLQNKPLAQQIQMQQQMGQQRSRDAEQQSWATTAQRLHSGHSGLISPHSPHPPHPAPYQALQARRPASPPIQTHSRASSYSSLNPSGPAGLPVRDAPNLQPSPYANIQQGQYAQQLQPHPQQPPPQQHVRPPSAFGGLGMGRSALQQNIQRDGMQQGMGREGLQGMRERERDYLTPREREEEEMRRRQEAMRSQQQRDLDIQRHQELREANRYGGPPGSYGQGYGGQQGRDDNIGKRGGLR